MSRFSPRVSIRCVRSEQRKHCFAIPTASLDAFVILFRSYETLLDSRLWDYRCCCCRRLRLRLRHRHRRVRGQRLPLPSPARANHANFRWRASLCRVDCKSASRDERGAKRRWRSCFWSRVIQDNGTTPLFVERAYVVSSRLPGLPVDDDNTRTKKFRARIAPQAPGPHPSSAISSPRLGKIKKK
jgi:hypothetical protein